MKAAVLSCEEATGASSVYAGEGGERVVSEPADMVQIAVRSSKSIVLKRPALLGMCSCVIVVCAVEICLQTI